MKSKTFRMVNLENTKRTDFWDGSIKAYEHFKQMRAEIIDASLFVENQLSSLLVAFLAEPDSQRAHLIHALVLDADSCSFFQKWRLLKELLQIYAVPLNLDSERMKLLRKELHEVVSLRNRFAHGHLEVDASDLSVWMDYYEGSKRRVRLEDAELIAAQDLFSRVQFTLTYVFSVLHDRDFELPVVEA